MKKIVSIFFILLLSCSAMFGKSLSFQVVQHNESIKDVCSTVLVLEDEILNFFFDLGYIVSNEPAVVSNNNEKDVQLWNSGFNASIDGSCDNFIQIVLYFNESDSLKNDVQLGYINKVTWKIASAKNGKIISEASNIISKPIGVDTEDNVRNFAIELAAKLQRILKMTNVKG